MPLAGLIVSSPIIYGDHPGTIGGFAKTGGFTINLTTPTLPAQTLVGDCDLLTGFATGGGNTLSQSNGNLLTVIGDALSVNGFAHAGGNTVSASSFAAAYAAGDAVTLAGFAQGGHNTVSAAARGGGTAYGDALTMTDFAKGGYNVVRVSGRLGEGDAYGDAGTLSGFAVGGHNSVSGGVNIYGDAYQMTDFARGGSNTVTAPLTFLAHNMYGDAYALSGFAQGGGNTLVGASSGGGAPFSPYNIMYGDGHDMLGSASGGGNTLIAGQNVDNLLWGGAAVVSPTAHIRANTFEFKPGTSHDVIMDFRSGQDHIDLQGFGVTDFQALSSLFQQTAIGLDIAFSASDAILLHGVSQVAAGDFVFT